MRLEARIAVQRPPEQVNAYLGDISNVQKWDRGVGSVRALNNLEGVGFEFETLGRGPSPERARMVYRVVEATPHGSTTALISRDGNARFFRSALWRFRVTATECGSLIVCTAEFRLRRRYLILAPLFYSMKGAIERDLRQLKEKLEAAPATH